MHGALFTVVQQTSPFLPTYLRSPVLFHLFHTRASFIVNHEPYITEQQHVSHHIHCLTANTHNLPSPSSPFPPSSASPRTSPLHPTTNVILTPSILSSRYLNHRPPIPPKSPGGTPINSRQASSLHLNFPGFMHPVSSTSSPTTAGLRRRVAGRKHPGQEVWGTLEPMGYVQEGQVLV